MSIQNDYPERQHGADPPDACETPPEARTQAPSARAERGRSPSTRTNARLTERAAGPPAPAELSQYRAGRVQRQARDSEPTETVVGLPLMLDAVRAVLRDELGELRRELTTQLATGDEVLTMDAAARLLRVSSKTVRNWIHEHGLPASKIGVEWRFRRSEVVRRIGEHHVQ
jgi:excisionase family DNA binding protein